MCGPIADMGEDIDLLFEPDQWLENHRILLQQRLSEAVAELDSVMRSQRAKRELQQRNLVAVKYIGYDNNGDQIPIMVVLPLVDAINVLDRTKQTQTTSEENANKQLRVWESDGYDVEAARQIKRKKRSSK